MKIIKKLVHLKKKMLLIQLNKEYKIYKQDITKWDNLILEMIRSFQSFTFFFKSKNLKNDSSTVVPYYLYSPQ